MLLPMTSKKRPLFLTVTIGAGLVVDLIIGLKFDPSFSVACVGSTVFGAGLAAISLQLLICEMIEKRVNIVATQLLMVVSSVFLSDITTILFGASPTIGSNDK